MAWELLREDYIDAVWSGLKKYAQVDNADGTVSFQDVTVYLQKEKSFFGAMDANRMNEAMNIIMTMLENGTDLYTAFQNYFELQKGLFETKAQSTQQDFNEYVDQLKLQGDQEIEVIKTDYRQEITRFEEEQEAEFNIWFESVKDVLDAETAGRLFLMIEELQAQQPTQLIATITDFGASLPNLFLWRTSNAFGVGGFGYNTFGGGETESFPVKGRKNASGHLEIYSVPEIPAGGQASRMDEDTYLITYANQSENLILKV